MGKATQRLESICLFAPQASESLGARIASELGVPLTPHEEREFEGGEHKMRPLASVRGRTVYVVQNLHGDERGSANDRLCRLLFFVGALQDAGAARVVACIPYLAYARKDQRTKARDPVNSRYVAQLMEAMGLNTVLALEVHNRAAFDNAFRIPTVHVEAARLFAQQVLMGPHVDRTVVSPDIGGIKRARHFQEILAKLGGRPVGLAFVDKNRSDGVVSGDGLVGSVAGRGVILIDDLIGSGTTLLRAVAACRAAGADRIDAVATHAPFAPDAVRLFEAGGPDSVLISDSVPLPPGFPPAGRPSPTVVSIAPLFAEAIRRLELGGPLSELNGL